jgi:molybdate transport system regulatory protein
MKINNKKTDKPGIRLKVYVREDMVGGGKLDLLKTVGETGSISSAAKTMGLDYKRAWFLLDTLQRCFKDPLFKTNRGGGSSGGTTLTQLGSQLIEKFSNTDIEVKKVTSDFLKWLEKNQRT